LRDLKYYQGLGWQNGARAAGQKLVLVDVCWTNYNCN
jgi:hypothetical protein